MAHKVLKPFRDKTDNRKLYQKGDSYKHEDADRIAFLIEKGFIQEKSKQPPKKQKKADRK